MKILIAALALALAGSVFAKGKTVDQLIADLRYGTPEVRELAIDELASQASKKAAPVLLEALEDSSGTVKLKVIQALGTAGDSSAVPALSAILADPSVEFRVEAIKSLGEIGDDHAGAALLAKLNDSESEIRAAAAMALGKCRVKKANLAIKDLLKDKSRLVRLAAVDSLGLLGDIQALPELKAQLADKDPAYKRHVVKAIGSLADNGEVNGLLTGWLEDKDAYLRGFSAEALRSKARIPEAEAPLVNLLIDPVLAVRIRAVETLGVWKSKEAVSGLKKTLKDSNQALRWKAAIALGQIADPAASDALKYVADNDPEVENKKAAAEALDLIKAKR